MAVCRWRELGRLSYADALALQREAVERRIEGKCGDLLLFVEHPAVITLGKVAKREHVVAPREGTEVVETDRGGDVTYHGPGQLVGYPILLLREGERDLHRYLRNLEQALIDAATAFGIAEAGRHKGLTGLWIGAEGSPNARKLASIGIAVKRWVTLHGFALNVCNDLSRFALINPCGLEATVMGSLATAAGRPITMREAKTTLAPHLAHSLNRHLVD